MYLAITDGTTTITLSGTSPVLGCTYYPATAQRSGGAYQPVTETAEINLRGTAAAMRTTINAIEDMLQAAIQRQARGVGERVFVLYKPVDGDSAAYRSEVLDGRVMLSNEPMLRRFGDTSPTIRIGVIWQRAHWWEGALTELSISANGQAASTGGRTIYNDPANGNWLQIAADQVTGVLPAPVRLELFNGTGASKNYRKMFLAVNANSDPANLTHFLQAEARLSGGTLSADATCSGSGNNCLNFMASPPITLSWTLPSATLQKTRGRVFRILARFADHAGAMYVTPHIADANGTIIWTGDEVALDFIGGESWRDLGAVSLPPGGYATDYGAHRLVLVFRGGAVVQLDVLQLTATDSYRYLGMPATGVAVPNAGAIVHDGIEGAAYVLSGLGGTRTALASSYGGPLTLEPGMVQRIYVLNQIDAGLSGGAGGAPIGGIISARVFYRPRRLTV